MKNIPILRDFIEEASSSDQAFLENNDLLNTAENITLHYTAEQARNWDLHTAALKESVHFTMIGNCTQYDPLLVELLFHQFSFQERYLDLMKDGYFTFKLRGIDISVFVGNDAVKLWSRQLNNVTQSTSYKNNNNRLIKTSA